VDELTQTTGIVALGAALVALIGLGIGIAATVRLRRLQTDQRVVLGGSATDLVAHAAGLERSFTVLHDYVEDIAAALGKRLDTVEHRLDGAIAYHGLVRYDAYNEMSGRQSTTVALLDTTRSGVVLSSIHHRDTARLYAKVVRDGRGELQLSPEEEEAIRIALDNDVTLREVVLPVEPPS
jgi:hypothetical protein